MSILVSLCHIKFEIDLSVAMDGNKSKCYLLRCYLKNLFLKKKIAFFSIILDSEGAAAVCVRQNPHNDQRQPKKIIVENFTNKQNDCDEHKGILPSGSRETTPMTDDIKTVEEKGFLYGNPFVEVTKGIIHIYKKK